MSAVAAVNPKMSFNSASGVPLSGGSVTVYRAGTSTKTTTWQDRAQTAENTNPIILNSRGECNLWLDPSLTYKLVVKNAAGETQYTSENVTGVSPASIAAAAAQAELAADASFALGPKYADEATGRAAVANGAVFLVVGSGDVAAYEYRRVDASNSTLIATYPSRAAVRDIATKTVPVNLYDWQTHIIEERRLSSGTGAIITSGTYTADDCIARVPVAASTDYVISGYLPQTDQVKTVRYEDEFNQLIDHEFFNIYASRLQFTTPAGCAFVVFTVRTADDDSDRRKYMMFELGTAETYFVEHVPVKAAEVRSTEVQAARVGPDAVVLAQTKRAHVASREFALNYMHDVVFKTTYTVDPDILAELGPIVVTRTGDTYTTDYDWTAIKTGITTGATSVWVDPENGDDLNDGLSVGAPKLKLSSVLAVGSGALNVTILGSAVRFTKDTGWGGASVNRAVSIVCPGGYAEITTEVPITWAADVTHTNTYSGSYAVDDCVIIDKTWLNKYGKPRRLTLAPTAAAVNVAPGSYFHDEAADILYVRTFDSREPDSDVLVLEHTPNVVHTSEYNVYLENLRIWGGSGAAAANFTNANTTRRKVVTKNCEFSYSSQNDGVASNQLTTAYHYHGWAQGNQRDGFNYENNGTKHGHGFEFYCNGSDNGIIATGGADNGSTGHGSARVLRVAGTYTGNVGRQVHDIDDVVSDNIGLSAGDSQAALLVNQAAFACGTGASDNTRARYLHCNGVGITPYLSVIADTTCSLLGGNLLEHDDNTLDGDITELQTLISLTV